MLKIQKQSHASPRTCFCRASCGSSTTVRSSCSRRKAASPTMLRGGNMWRRSQTLVIWHCRTYLQHMRGFTHVKSKMRRRRSFLTSCWGFVHVRSFTELFLNPIALILVIYRNIGSTIQTQQAHFLRWKVYFVKVLNSFPWGFLWRFIRNVTSWFGLFGSCMFGVKD